MPRRAVLRLPDGYETPVYVHDPPDPQTPVLYVHGIQSHPGWFVGSAVHLAATGRAVFQATRRGSGENQQDRGHAESAAQLLDDISAAIDLVAEQTGLRGVHLVGVSWGGKLLASYVAARRCEAVASLTLVAPGIVPRVDVDLWTKAAIGICLCAAPRKRFQIPLNDVAMFTDNEAMRQYLRSDPHRLLWATARLLWTSRQLDRTLARAPRGAIQVPTTLLLAGRDTIIDNDATRAVVDRLTAGRAHVEQFDAAHTLEFQPDPQAFYESLTRAIQRGERTSHP